MATIRRQTTLSSVSRRSTGTLDLDGPIVSSPLVSNDELEMTSLQAKLRPYRSFSSTISAEASAIWEETLDSLTILEARTFKEYSKEKLADYVKDIEGMCDKQNQKSKGVKIAKFFRPFFKTSNLYAPIAQTLTKIDSTSSASFVLGGITCVLAISERFLDFREKIVDMLADMGERTELLAQYSDEVYARNPAVQIAIVKVFADVVEFCKKALSLFRDEKNKPRSSLTSFLKTIGTSFDEYFSNVLKDYEKDLKLFEEKAKLCDRREEREYRAVDAEVSMYGLQTLDRTNAGIQSLLENDANKRQRQTLKDEEDKAAETKRAKQDELREIDQIREKVINWVEKSSLDFFEEHSKKIEARQADTGDWILKHRNYNDWKSNDEELLLVAGHPGCGKTILASSVIENIRSTCEAADNSTLDAKEKIAFGFIYCSKLISARSDITVLLRSLVRQLSRQLKSAIDPYLESLFKRHDGARPLELNEAKQALESLLTRFRKTYIVVDGLDELHKSSDEHFEEYCQYFRSICQVQDQQYSVKLMALARPSYPAIESMFEGALYIHIASETNAADIKSFIDKHLDKIGRHHKLKPAVLDEIKTDIFNRADGMFLWTDMVIKSLQQERTANGVRRKIKELPQGLDSLYTAQLRRVVERGDHAIRILLWVTNAKRPLKYFELQEALAIETGTTEIDEGDIVSSHEEFCIDCENLIVFDQKGGTYELLHTSFRDYLMSAAAVPQDFRDVQQIANKLLAEACLTYLQFDTFSGGPFINYDDLDLMMTQHPFLSYATKYWGRHVADARDGDTNLLAKDFVVNKPRHRDLSWQLFWDTDRNKLLIRGGSTPLHVLAMFDLVDVAEEIPNVSSYQSKVDGVAYSPLEHALIHRNRSICTWILDDISDTDFLKIQTHCVYEPLILAAENAWPEVVQSLINRGRPEQWQGIALHAAAFGGSVEVLRILLEAGLDIDTRDINGSTALYIAAVYDHFEIAKELITNGANVNIVEWAGVAPLHLAAANTNLPLVQLLLESGANGNAKCSKRFATPLHRTITQDGLQVFNYLLDQRVDLDQVNDDGETALVLSAFSGRLYNLTALLTAGASPDILTNYDQSLLHAAAEGGHLKVLHYIFEEMPSYWSKMINTPDSGMYTPLHCATTGGNLDIVRFLVDNGASRKTAPGSPCPVHLAIREGHADIVDFFLQKDPECVTWDADRGLQFLHFLAGRTRRFPELSQFLEPALKAGADPNKPTDTNTAPAHFAIDYDNLPFVQELQRLAPQVDLGLVSQESGSLIRMAASLGDEEALDWLMANRNYQKPDLDIAVFDAVDRGHLSIVKRLLGVTDINIRDEQGFSLLHTASFRGHYEVVEYLLDQKADPNIQINTKDTPLHCSAQSKRTDITKLLLDHNADPNICNSIGESPLYIVSRHDKIELVEMLLDKTSKTSFNNTNRPPFLPAIKYGEDDVLQAFVDRQMADWEIVDDNGKTTFHYLANYGNIHRIRRFIDFVPSAIRGSIDANNETALDVAAVRGHVELFAELIDLGVPIRVPESSTTPSYRAASSGCLDALREMLRLQSDVAINEISAPFSQTALHRAVINAGPLTAKVLLDSGADPLLKDVFGLAPVDYAIAHSDGWNKSELLTSQHRQVRDFSQIRSTVNESIRELQRIGTPKTWTERLNRFDSVRNLALGLCYLNTRRSIDGAVICFAELFLKNRAEADWSLVWRCSICRATDSHGFRYTCIEVPTTAFLCKNCYQLAGTDPDSIDLLEDSEERLRLLKQAIYPYYQLGTDLILDAFRLMNLDGSFMSNIELQTNMFLDKSRLFNASDRYALPGFHFLGWLQRALDGQNLQQCDKDLAYHFALHRPDKERWWFRCKEHDFLEIPDFCNLTQEEKDYFDSDQRITSSWLGQLETSLDMEELQPTRVMDSILNPGEDEGYNEKTIIVRRVARQTTMEEEDLPPIDVKNEYIIIRTFPEQRDSKDETVIAKTVEEVIINSRPTEQINGKGSSGEEIIVRRTSKRTSTEEEIIIRRHSTGMNGDIIIPEKIDGITAEDDFEKETIAITRQRIRGAVESTAKEMRALHGTKVSLLHLIQAMHIKVEKTRLDISGYVDMDRDVVSTPQVLKVKKEFAISHQLRPVPTIKIGHMTITQPLSSAKTWTKADMKAITRQLLLYELHWRMAQALIVLKIDSTPILELFINQEEEIIPIVNNGTEEVAQID